MRSKVLKKIHKKERMTIVTWTFALQNLPSIYQFGSNFVKQLFRIQIQKRLESIILEPSKI